MADLMMKTCMAAILAITVTGCSSDSSDDDEDNPDPGGNPEPVTQQYEVTLTNLTGGQVFSEPVLVLHPDSDSFWEIGQPASEELEVLAESGAATGISTLASDGSYPFVESETSIDPGGNQTFTIATSSADDDVLTILTRLESTDDGFTGVNAVSLAGLTESGQSITIDRWALDSGTEENLESTNLGSVDSGRPSEPDDVLGSEFNFVTVHPGVITEIESIPNNTSQLNQSHKFDNPVIRIQITRIEG